MAKKYYAVRKGLTPGIYLTWEDCKKNIDGYSGASYKGFATIEEAEAFLFDREALSNKKSSALDAHLAEKKLIASQYRLGADYAIAYVDGSYNVATGEYAYGAVIFCNGCEEHFSEKFSDDEMAKMRNVAGEIEGSMCAMRYCLERGIKKLAIYYDYEGIEKWCNGEWKANKKGTIAYQEFYREATKSIEISFVKVKGHSGNQYNDLADALAKKAAGVE